jgi:hypothetical protein
MSDTKSLAVALLTLAALALMVAAYFTPIWSASLTSQQYGREAFPQGIRVVTRFDGVFNGCEGIVIKKSEVFQGELGGEREEELRQQADQAQALDCLHEMNVINHYIGMYPMQMGAPVERAVAPYLFGVLGVMLLAFVAERRRTQLIILATGFAVVLVWMVGEMLWMGGLEEYLADFRDKASPYYSHDPGAIARWVNTSRWVIQAAMAGVAVLMLLMLAGVWMSRKFTLVLALVPALLPIFFLADYMAWNWYFGHHMHSWRAFPLEPFMPVIFGEGMVAQFTIRSGPEYGFGLLVLASLLLVAALLLRRKTLRAEPA